MQRLLLITACTLLMSCGESQSTGVKDAKGETTAKYIICGPGEANCFVAARFKDLQACQSHKDWADMLCDSKSNPGTMICKRDTGIPLGTAYCTL